MPFLQTIAGLTKRVLQRTDAGLRRAGLNLGVIETPSSRAAGFTVQWRRDPPNIVRGAVVVAQFGDTPVRLFVEDDSDLIQRSHLRGELCEGDDLAAIAAHVRGVVVDVGTNVGNHAVFFLTLPAVERVIAFEPNPAALRVLEVNIALNGLGDRIELHRVGLGDRSASARALSPFANISGTWLEEEADGAIQIVAGDTLLAGQRVDFLKIDVEGMEMKALAGLAETIQRERPAIFIEVDDKNADAFGAWCAANAYTVAQTFRHYAWNANHLIVPDDHR